MLLQTVVTYETDDEAAELLVKALNTIATIASGDGEYAGVVKERGGVELLESIEAKREPAVDEVGQAAASALLTIRAMLAQLEEE